MFFQLHQEKKIGYKELTNADLGRQSTSHQTHIGLFDDVLTYLPNNIEINDCMTIFDNNVEFLSVNFDRIENPNHTFRSPKIRAGGRDAISVVSFIRDKVKESGIDTKWFLFWFGLKSGQPVFFLFNENSTTYKDIILLGIELKKGVKNRIESNMQQFDALLKYLEKIVNDAGINIAEELEVIAQTTDVAPKKYRETDINRAREIFSKIGKEGEILVDKYFTYLQNKKEIISYKWVNEEKESGLPYDFYFETNSGEIIFLDVKTTNYKFNQKMVFSNQEINFATSTNSKYCIYRVYINEDGNRCLKICSNAKGLFMFIHCKTSDYESVLNNIAKLETLKLAILPTQEDLTFGQQILLNM